MLLSLVHFACAIWSRHWSGQVVAISNGKSSCWSFHISSRCSRGAPAVRPSAGGSGNDLHRQALILARPADPRPGHLGERLAV